MAKPLRLTNKEIEAGKTAAGGFSKDQLAEWGIPWPPPKGWRKALLDGRPVGPRYDREGILIGDDNFEPSYSTTGMFLSPIRPHVAAHDSQAGLCGCDRSGTCI